MHVLNYLQIIWFCIYLHSLYSFPTFPSLKQKVHKLLQPQKAASMVADSSSWYCFLFLIDIGLLFSQHI